MERLIAHFHAQHWEWNEAYVFRDDGFSGASLKRPGLDRLRDKVGLAELERVVITAPDRLARKYLHQMLLIEEFEKAGCQVEFIERPMSDDPNDQLLLQIRGAVAEYERTLITERMRRGRQQRYRAGQLLPWSIPPYGYRLKPDQPRNPASVYLEESEAAVVTLIFDYYLEQNHTLGDLSRHLLALGISAPKGKKRWGFMSLRTLLTNPVYTGKVYAGRLRTVTTRKRMSALRAVSQKRQSFEYNPPEEWILVGQVPGIVTQEQFELVRMKLSQNQSFATRNNKSHQYLLRALVSCGVCNNACLGCTRGKNSYYACRAKGRIEISRIEEKCRSRYIPAGQLDELVWQDLCEVIQNPELTKVALQRALGGKWLPQELQARKENLRKVGTTLANQLERLTAAYLVGVIELEEYKRRRQEVEQRQRSLEEQAKQLEVSVKRRVELEGIARSIEEFCERVREGLAKADFEQKRRLVELLIDRVVVRNEEVEIRYVVPTSARSEHLHFYQLVTDYFRSIIVRKYYCGGLYNAIAANLCQENLSQCFQLIQKKFIALTKPAGFSALIANVKDLIRPRSELLAENALLRQQLIVLQRQVKRPAFKPHDKFLLVLLASLVKPWRKALLILQPDTLLRWDRQAFKLLWTFKSKPKKRKARISQQTIALIRQMAQENPLWGAEPIHGELLKLNIQVSKQPSESI